MKRKILSFLTFASLTAGFSVQAAAEEITVKEGDTLWDIAEQNDVEVESIIDWNNLSSDKIHPEDLLVLNVYHEVKLGETLWDISKEYKVGIDEIEKWNKLDSHIIQPGDKLLIKHSEQEEDSTDTVDKAKNVDTPKSEVKAEAVNLPDAENQVVEAEKTESDETDQDGQELIVTATAYTANCEGCSGTTAMGIDLNANPDKKVIAVDPSVIPLGSTVQVEGYGTAIAADTGGAILGNKIDVFIPSKSDAINWGRKKVKIKILD